MIAAVASNNDLIKKLNIQTLSKRVHGRLYTVDSHGKLRILSIWERLRCFFSKEYSTKIQLRVKNVIDPLLTNLSIVDLSSQGIKCEDFFFKRMARLSTRIWSRTLSYDTFQYLRKTAPEVERGSYAFMKLYKEAHIWYRLGNYFCPSGGTSGSYCIYRGKVLGKGPAEILGLFKPKKEAVYSLENPNYFKRFKALIVRTIGRPFKGQLVKSNGPESYVAEEATKIIEQFILKAVNGYLTHYGDIVTREDRILLSSLSLVPETHVATFETVKKGRHQGSFQLWVKEPHVEAADYLGVDKQCHPISDKAFHVKLPFSLFQLLVILDLVSGQMDRKADNWFVIYGDLAKKIISGIRLFDGSYSMTPDFPEFFWEYRNQNLWGNLPIAHNTFDLLGRYIINYLHEHRNDISNSLMDLYNKELPERSKRNIRRIDCLNKRIELIKKACFDINLTIRKLSNIKSKASVEKFITKRS